MQLDVNTAATFIIVIAFGVQVGWTFLLRRGQKDYVQDLYHFRFPTTAFSRYYSWRVSSFIRTIGEAIVVNIVSLGSVIYFGFLVLGYYGLRELSWFIFLMIGFSIITLIQIILGARRMYQIERGTIQQLDGSLDKIAEAKAIVDRYIQENIFTKVDVWLALFRVAQIQDSNGWAMRDILLKKRDISEVETETNPRVNTENTPGKTSGPSIE